MIYANDASEVEKRSKAFLRKWREKCDGVAILRFCDDAWARRGVEFPMEVVGSRW